jgi:hypothetical protein
VNMLRVCGTYGEEMYGPQDFDVCTPRDEATWKT